MALQKELVVCKCICILTRALVWPSLLSLQSMARSKVYKSKPKPVEKELPSDDEIDAFDKQKDFISLDAARESESDDVQDEGLYDLSDDADDSSEDEFDSDDSDAAGGTLGRRKSCS